MKSISNKTVVKVFAEKTSNDIKKLLLCVFPSNYVMKFIKKHTGKFKIDKVTYSKP